MHVLKKHPTLTHTQTLLDICKPLALFDITTFVHVRMNQRGELSGLCTNPNFLINYVDKSYHNADIHVRKNHADLGSCLLWDAMECFGETEKTTPSLLGILVIGFKLLIGVVEFAR